MKTTKQLTKQVYSPIAIDIVEVKTEQGFAQSIQGVESDDYERTDVPI